ncbi:hypothetical protein [Actinopolyspora erythraea]|uniref:hypothetical protein n=1 Tax=Actinopolyspora erythraea TaxID=414996 RepID=UPI001184BFF8|nr:hypothetical protein [Actinopolyspora erythraea]
MAERLHTAFEYSGDDPERAVVRLHLWFPAEDLTTAAGLVREPVRRHDAASVELLPAGKHPADGYHAALLYALPTDMDDDRESTLRAVAATVARTLGSPEEEVRVEPGSGEPIAVAARMRQEREAPEPRVVTGRLRPSRW